ncbi:hypothetical protein HJC23_003680 [Cyclotella cryptica]|uniref:Yippee domain-containing protein n=1 Tax=Cyclotella cryptica TaxID=29204 RepID=A0ABD3P326_9STRA
MSSQMTSSPPPLPVFSEGTSSGSSSLRSKTSTISAHSKVQRSSPSFATTNRHEATLALSKRAQLENDSMVYLDGPQVYTCGQCRTHLTSHDDIISKSFHGRKGRAYLFDQCVNITLSPPEDRFLITGLHTVCDISCKRCQTLIGWTYAKAYEPSQKYKEGKFIIEKINLHLEEADGYQVDRPAGERGDKWRVRSMSWGSERGMGSWDAGCGDGSSQSGYLGSSPCVGSSLAGSFGRSESGASSYLSGASSPTPGASNMQYNQYHRSPRTPNRSAPVRHDRISSGPMSPRSPSQIIYEYQDNDD